MQNNYIEYLKKIIIELKNEIKDLDAKNYNLKKENENLKNENINLKNENYNLQDKNSTIKRASTINTDARKIIELYEKLELKEKEIKEIKNKNELYISDFVKDHMTVIFYSVDQNIHYSLICKETDTFSTVEKQLYEVYPECKESEFFFMANGEKIKRFKTLKENKIKNSQVITLTEFE